MTVREFCLRGTLALQLCAIREDGWIVEVVWIDHEDLFRISEKSRDRKVLKTSFGTLPIVKELGTTIEVPCLFIDT